MKLLNILGFNLKYFFTYLFLFSSLLVNAQKIEKKPISPKKASTLSAIIPGLGQVYNKKYWKTPLIYAGIGTTIYFAKENQKNYTNYKDALIKRNNGEIDVYDGIYTESQMLTIIDYYQRNRDLSYILTGVIYILNIVDASVDAHMFNFNVDENLSLNAQPNIFSSTNGLQPGLLLQLNF